MARVTPGRLCPGTPCTALLLLLCAGALAPARAQAPDPPAPFVAGRSGGAQATPRDANSGCPVVCDHYCSSSVRGPTHDFFACLSDPGITYTPNGGGVHDLVSVCTGGSASGCPNGYCYDGVGTTGDAARATQLDSVSAACSLFASAAPNSGWSLQQSTYNCAPRCPPTEPTPTCTTVCDEYCSSAALGPQFDLFACLSDPQITYAPNPGSSSTITTCTGGGSSVGCPSGQCWIDGSGATDAAALAAQLAFMKIQCAYQMIELPLRGHSLKNSSLHCVPTCAPPPPAPPPPLPGSGGVPSGEPAPSQPTPGAEPTPDAGPPSAPTPVVEPAPGCDLVCDQYCSRTDQGNEIALYACLSDPTVTFTPNAGASHVNLTSCTAGGGASVSGCPDSNFSCFDSAETETLEEQLALVNSVCTLWMEAFPADGYSLKNSSFHCAEVCPTPSAGVTPAPPAPIGFTASVSVSFGLGGVNASAFGNNQKIAFRAALVTTLSLQDLSFVVVEAVADAPGRRRLMQSGAIAVATSIFATSATQGALQGKLSALQADQSGLTAALAASGLPVSVRSMSAPVWRALVPAPPGPPSASAAAYVISGAIAIAGYAAPSVTPTQLTGFSAGLAATLKKNAVDVPVIGASPSQRAAGRRRVLADAAAVAFNVRAATRREADTVVSTLVSSGTMDVLASNLQGTFPGVKGSDLTLEVPPAMIESAAPRCAGALAACAAAVLAAALLTL